MAVFAIASMLFATACAWYAARVGEEVGHRLRPRLYRRVTELSWGNVDRLETSDLLVRLTTDINQVRVMTTSGVTTLLRAPLMIVGAILILLWVDVRLALVMLVFLPIVIGGAGLLPAEGRAALPRRCSPASTGSTRCCRRTWRASGSCRRSSARTTRTPASTRENVGLQHAATAAQSSAAFLNPALLLVINLGLAGALWVGGDLVIDGKIELGSVFVLLNYLVAVMIPLILLSVLLPQMASADSSVGRVRRGAGAAAGRAGEAGRAEPGRGGRRPGEGPGRLRGRQLLLPRRRRPAELRAGAQRHRPRRRAGPGGRDPRRDRLGQVDAREPAGALLRRDRRPGDDRRRRRARRHAAVAARDGHARDPAAEPVQRDDRGRT